MRESPNWHESRENEFNSSDRSPVSEQMAVVKDARKARKMNFHGFYERKRTVFWNSYMDLETCFVNFVKAGMFLKVYRRTAVSRISSLMQCHLIKFYVNSLETISRLNGHYTLNTRFQTIAARKVHRTAYQKCVSTKNHTEPGQTSLTQK